MGIGRKTKKARVKFLKGKNLTTLSNDLHDNHEISTPDQQISTSRQTRKRASTVKDGNDKKKRRSLANANSLDSKRNQEIVEKRKTKNAMRMALLRSQETAEERAERLNRHNYLRCARRANETNEEREARLQKQKIYNKNYREKLRQFKVSI